LTAQRQVVVIVLQVLHEPRPWDANVNALHVNSRIEASLDILAKLLA
jgi:hypothetical protein